MGVLYFTVDAALLEELGERLIGKPYIAVAELVKNSYDADSLRVIIRLDPDNDTIEVEDFGNGMTFEEFNNFWMRVGSTHKFRQKISRNLGRPLTGSKGVGRLSVQFLANILTLETVSEYDLHTKIIAHVKWDEAVRAGDLTEAAIEFELVSSVDGFKKCTKIILTQLKHDWNESLIVGLAKEVWKLKSPFRSPILEEKDPQKIFDINFESPQKGLEEKFQSQINAIMDIWYAKLVGKNIEGNVIISLEYSGENPIIREYQIPNNKLISGDFEIRIYHLYRRQPRGILVGEAREYLNDYGGVHVYDGGFHLPYFGDPQNDWLSIEFDHSHRLTVSKLLPDDFKLYRGLQFLPTISRLFGVVNVDTSIEPDLDILITRDRLQESIAYSNLVFMVRYALDFYAYEEQKRNLEKELLELQIDKPKFFSLNEVLMNYQKEIPKQIFENLRENVLKTAEHIESEAEIKAKQVAIIGPLATAGITSLAHQHETERQLVTIDDIINQLEDLEATIVDRNIRKNLKQLRDDLSSWVARVRQIFALFSYFQDSENIQYKQRYNAKFVLGEIEEQVESLARGIPIKITNLENVLLPEASLIEWSAIFQNVFTNAFNAMIDSEHKLIQVSQRMNENFVEILIQDTGIGIDLSEAESFFKPFVRKTKISPERRALGYGGMGLGLAIVRLIANNIGCIASFVEPDEGFSTAFSLKWREKE